MKTPGRTLAAAVILAAALALPAAAEKAPRRLVVAVEAKGGDSYTTAELLQLSRSLMAAVQATEILVLDWGPDPFPSDTPESAEATVKRTADCWVLVTVGGGRKSPTLTVRSYDVLAKRTVIEERLQLDAAFDLPDPPAAAWKKLVDLLAGAYPPLDTDQPLKTAAAERPSLWTKGTATLTLHAVPGTVLGGLDGDPRTVGEDGILKETVRSPATYLLTAKHPGRLPLEMPIYLEDDREVTLPQHSPARWSVDAGLYGMSFPHVEGSFFIVPGWLYVRAGLMTYLGGLAFNDEQMFWSAPLTTVSVRLGTYAVFPQESWFRAYVGAGAFLRVAHPLGDPAVYLDQAASWGFQLALGIEASPWPQTRSRFFFEWLPTEYITPYPDLFLASMSRVGDGIAVLPYAVVDFGGFRVGWRWML